MLCGEIAISWEPFGLVVCTKRKRHSDKVHGCAAKVTKNGRTRRVYVRWPRKCYDFTSYKGGNNA